MGRLAKDRRRAALVRIVGVGIDEADRDRLNAFRQEVVAASRTDGSSNGVTTLPSAPMRSTASNRQRRGTSGSGLRQARSNMPGVRIRPISSTSRKPRVVSRPVRAPTFCRIVFDATVVPCTTSATSLGSSRASCRTAGSRRRRLLPDHAA